jgi:hypothetical protein
MALQRTRRPRIRSGRSLRSLGSPLNARPLGSRGSYQTVRLATSASLLWRNQQTASVAVEGGAA